MAPVNHEEEYEIKFKVIEEDVKNVIYSIFVIFNFLVCLLAKWFGNNNNKPRNMCISWLSLLVLSICLFLFASIQKFKEKMFICIMLGLIVFSFSFIFAAFNLKYLERGARIIKEQFAF